MSDTQWKPHEDWRPVMPFRELIEQPHIKEVLEADPQDDVVRHINEQIERVHPNSGHSFTREEYDLAQQTALHFTKAQQGHGDQSARNYHRDASITLYPAAFDGKIAINLSDNRHGKVTSTSGDSRKEIRSDGHWLTCHVSRSLELRNQRERIEFRKEHTFSRSDKKFLENFRDEADQRYTQAVRHVITQKESGKAGSYSPQQSLQLVAQRGASGAGKALWEDQVFGSASQKPRVVAAC